MEKKRKLNEKIFIYCILASNFLILFRQDIDKLLRDLLFIIFICMFLTNTILQ